MKQETAQTETAGKRKGPVRVYSAREKTQAVLAVWSARRSPSAMSRELGVPWAVLHGWEKRALAGMLNGLDAKWKGLPPGQTALPARVERLIEQTIKPTGAVETEPTN